MSPRSTKPLPEEEMKAESKAQVGRSSAEYLPIVSKVLAEAPIVDVHTHLFPASAGKLCLRGIDELLTYHYLMVETLRYRKITPREFLAMEKARQADEVWKTLFVEHTPVSEASRGVLTVLEAFGLDTRSLDLDQARSFFGGMSPQEHIDIVLKKANIQFLVMTNDIFDQAERDYWGPDFIKDRRFRAAMRIEMLINSPERALSKMREMGYDAGRAKYDVKNYIVERFLESARQSLDPVYVAASLPHTFRWDDGSFGAKMLKEVLLPFCEANRLPMALMVGVDRQKNPELDGGGDSMGSVDVSGIGDLCRANPRVSFMVTLLSREDQHELCVMARKFPNLTPFGCWWFLNNPSLVDEITRMRLELLGLSFIPQHSDARVLDQLIYKWEHTRKAVARVLAEKYADLEEAGRPVGEDEVKRDCDELFSLNAKRIFGIS